MTYLKKELNYTGLSEHIQSLIVMFSLRPWSGRLIYIINLLSCIMASAKKEKLHKMPSDLKRVIDNSREAKKAWEEITPLARNEWICWVEDAKKEETRVHRI